MPRGERTDPFESRAYLRKPDGDRTSVAKLCRHSFLSLWSYPSVYRDQGRTGGRGDGKEICDLLVVFENHVLIFSDKDCEFIDTGNLELDWSQWYRKTVLEYSRTGLRRRTMDQTFSAEPVSR